VSPESTSLGYAKALFEVARAEGQITRVADELFRIARTLEMEHDLRQALTDIAVPIEGKEKLLSDLLGNRTSPHTLNIIKFVIGQGRGRDLVEIADQLAAIAEHEANREIAVVKTRVELDEDEKKRLAEALGKVTGKHLSVKVVVDPSVVGGVYAQVGDVVIDGTVRHKFQELRERLGVR